MMIRVLAFLFCVTIANAQSGWQRYISLLDTNNILATKTNIGLYQLLATKNSANGYAGLNASSLVLASQLGTGTSITTKYLRGDNTWQTIAGGGDQLASDTLTWDATKTNITSYLDSSKVLFWTDTTLANGVATNYDVNARADSATALYWADTSLSNGVVTNYDLSKLDSLLEKRYSRQYAYIYPNGGLATATSVGTATVTVTATAATNSQTTGPCIKHTSAATANTPTGVISPNFTITRRDWEPEFYAKIITDTKLDSLVYHVGFFSAAVDTARAPNRYEIKFVYHTSTDGTTWYAVTNNNSGAGQQKTSTGVTVSANTAYAMRIVCSTADANVKFYINGALVATNSGASLPTSTQGLGYGVRVVPRFTTGTSARLMSWCKIFMSWNG